MAAPTGYSRHSQRGSRQSRVLRGAGKPHVLSRKFNASRTKDVEDPERSDPYSPKALEDISADEEDILESSDEASIDGDAEIGNAYVTLLQTLNPIHMHSGPPPSKKRRIANEQRNGESHQQKKSPQDVSPNDDLATQELDDPDVGDDDAASLNDEDVEEYDSDDNTAAGRDMFVEHLNPSSEEHLLQLIDGVKSAQSPPRKSVHDSQWRVLTVGEESMSERGTVKSLKDRDIKQKIYQRANKNAPDLTKPINSLIAQSLFDYEDVLFCDRTAALGEDLRKLAALHALNHVMKTRDRIVKNTARLAKQTEPDDGDVRDQGFTRPKVLFLLPTRHSCSKVVEAILSFCETDQQENKKRFLDGYTQSQGSVSTDKPSDFRDLFEGNDDDMFRIGLKFTRKTVKFFSQFYSSDIILASPLGLRMAIGAETSSKQDHDFLSSIEVLVVDQADAMLMQNWDHVDYILSHLNLHPKESHGCDFSRVRNWYLDGHARYLRQTVVFSAFNTPEINKIFGSHMLNVAGKVKISQDKYDGTIASFGGSVKQRFLRFEAADPSSEPDYRFKYFTAKTVPNILKRTQAGSGPHGILIFVPSYLDFVRVRNYMAGSTTTQDIAFGSISEYTQAKEVARARTYFMTGRHAVLLYSGRAHHFRRYLLKGVKSVFFYAPPDNPIFYKELAIDFLARSLREGTAEEHDMGSQLLFSRWDAMRLERIVGTERIGAMLGDGSSDTFTFM